MRIALDFDGTFTADPTFWLDFIQAAERSGHYVAIVTHRDQHNDGINWGSVGLKDTGPPCAVIWTDGMPKKDYIAELGHAKFDVWIDDNPYGILHGTTMHSREHLKTWRETDKHRHSSVAPHGDSRGFDHKDTKHE